MSQHSNQSNPKHTKGNTMNTNDPNKTSGGSPPNEPTSLTKSLNLIPGRVYTLTRDIKEDKGRDKKGRNRGQKVVARAGERFLYEVQGTQWQVLRNLGKGAGFHGRNKISPDVVAALAEASHDVHSILMSSGAGRDYEGVLQQLLTSGLISTEQLLATAKFYCDHFDALVEDEDRVRDEALRALAKGAARLANENDFSSRRGTYAIKDDEEVGSGLVCYYDNNPYSDNPTGREHELALIIAQLEEQGVDLAARATYPDTGADAGYTVVLIFRDAFTEQDDRVAKVKAVAESVLGKSLTEVAS